MLGLGTSVAAAAYESSGDQFYYADNPSGTIYCAAYNWAIHTNTGGGSTTGISYILDGKSKKDVFCANPATAPYGYNYAAFTLYSDKPGGSYFCGFHSNYNANGDWVARAGVVNDTTGALAFIHGGNCGAPAGYHLFFRTEIALNFGLRPFPASGWANSSSVHAN